MRTQVPLKVRQEALRLQQGGGLNFDEIGPRLGYAPKTLARATGDYRRGTFRNAAETKCAERMALADLVEAGASVEDVMARYGWKRRSALQRLARMGYGAAERKAIRVRLGLLKLAPTKSEQRAAARKALREERARAKAEREVARLAKRPPLMLSPRVRAVIEPIAREAGLSLADLTGGRRKQAFVKARHRAILALYGTFPDKSLCWLGRPFGMHRTSIRDILVDSGVYVPRRDDQAAAPGQSEAA